MALSYSFTNAPGDISVPAITAAVRFDQLHALVGRRVVIHSGPVSVAGRLARGVEDIFQISLDISDGFADARVRPEQVKSISYSRDTLTVDGIVAYIYLR